MNSVLTKWSPTTLARLLTPVSRPVLVTPLQTYALLGMHWYAEGLYIKERKPGNQIQANTLYQVKEGDFVYNRLFAWKGSFGIAGPDVADCYVSNEFPCFRVNESQVSPAFLHRYFSQAHIWVQIEQSSSGSTPTSRLRLKEEQLLSMQIPLPPLDEQRRIVARIDELAGKIEEARGLRREAAGEADNLLLYCVSSLSIREECWATLQSTVLNQKGAVRSGPFGSDLHHNEFVDSGVAAIGTRDVQVNRFVLSSGWYVTPQKFEQFRRYQVFPGDILVTIVGASIGRFCMVPPDVPLAFTTKHVMALTLDRTVAEPAFAAYLLNYHARCRTSLFAQCEGSAQPSLNSAKVLAIAFPVPSVSEQRSIIAYLDNLQGQIDSLRKLQAETAAELDALLPSVLDKAFRGEL